MNAQLRTFNVELRVKSPPAEREASGSPPREGLGGTLRLLGGIPFVTRRASTRWTEKARGLSERSEFPRAPAAVATRRIKRDTGVFFWFVFFHGKENEQTEQYTGSVEPLRVLHQRWRV